MIQYTVKKYTEKEYENWNDFIAQSKNATFLFHRDFMGYHQTRFEDFSLLIYKNKKIVAVLPANISRNSVYSHQGLTYGGLIYEEKNKLISVVEIFQTVLFFLSENQIEKLFLKTLPSIYHLKPAEEILYALFLVEAKLIRRDSLSVIDLQQEKKVSKIRKRGVQKAILNHLVIKEEESFDAFWNKILIPNLDKKHHKKPIHLVEEMNYLKSYFPENIRQFNVYFNEEIVAGTTIFETKTVAHCQYISKNENQNNLGSLDFLFHYLINEVFIEKKFFDFGISNENQGKKINAGLSYWKESFGASTIVHDFYEIDTTNYRLLNSILL